jgi:hypothetical protein
MPGTKSPIESLYEDKQEVTTGEPLMSAVPATTPGFSFEQKLKSAGSQDQMHFAKEHSFGANHRGQNFQRYYAHPSFSKLGFDPYIDNEAKYNENSSWTGDFWRAAKQIPGMMGRAAWDNATGFFNLTADGNTESSQAMEKSMSIANSSRGGVGGFVTNLAGNSAYTFGILGEMLLEEAAMLGLDALTGGATTPMHGPMEARHAMQLGRLGRTLSTTRDIFRSINTAQDARTFWNSAKTVGKGVGNLLNPLENTTRLLMAGDKLEGMTDAARAANSISDFAKMKKGAGAFYRDLRAMRAVLTESQLEGGFTETDTYDELSRDFYEKNGRLPEGKEADQIAAQSKSAGRATSFLNMPAIFLTNKIVLEQAVRGIGPRAILRELEKSGFSRTIVQNKGWKAALKEPFEFGVKGIRAAGTAQYWKNLPKAIGKGSLRYSAANFAEGFQESIQEGLQVGVKNYYLNQMEHVDREGTKLNSSLMWDSVTKGVNSQFSAQGAEVFASGFLMGSLVQGPKFLVNQSIKQYMKFTKPEQFKALRDQKEKAEQQLLDAMNDLYKDPAKYFEAITSGMTDQIDIHALMDEVEGDQKMGRDMVDEALLKHVHTLFHAGKTDLLVNQLSSLKELNPEELKEAFGMQADDPVDLHQRIDKTISDVKEMTARFKAVNENFTNPFDPKLYKQGTPEYEQEVMGYHGWRGAQLQVVFNRRAFDQALERMDSISNTALGNSGLSNVNALDYSLVFDEENAADEMKNLVKQISALSQGDAEARRESGKLKKKLSALVEFHTARDNYKKVMKELAAAQARNEKAKENGTNEEKIDSSAIKLAQKALKKSYNAYLKRITKPGTFNLDESTSKSFEQYVDFLRLSEDAQSFSTVVNQFHNPEAFTRLAQVHADVLAQVHANRRNHIEKSLKKWLKKKSTNELVTLLMDEGVYFEPESMLAMLESNTIPETFYDAVGHQAITKDSPKHKKAAEIIDKWMQGEGRVAAPATLTAPTPVAAPTQMTGATEKALRDKYMAAIVADPEVEKDYPTFEDWLNSTTAKTLVNTLQPVAPVVAPVASAAVPPTQTPVTPAAFTFSEAILTKLLSVSELKGNGNRSKREDIVKSIDKYLILARSTSTMAPGAMEYKRQEKSLVDEVMRILTRNGVTNNKPLAESLAAIMLMELGIVVPNQTTPVPLPQTPTITLTTVPVTPTPTAVQTDVPNVGDIVTVVSPFADDEDFPDGFKEMRVEEVKPVRDKTGKLTGGYVRAIPTDPNDKMGSLSPISLMDETDYHIGQTPVVENKSSIVPDEVQSVLGAPLLPIDQMNFNTPAIQTGRFALIKEGEPEPWMRIQETSRRNYISHLRGGIAFNLQELYNARESARANKTMPTRGGSWEDHANQAAKDAHRQLVNTVQDYFEYLSEGGIIDPKTQAMFLELTSDISQVLTGRRILPVEEKAKPEIPIPVVPINRTVQQIIDEVKENTAFITLSADGKSYVNQRTGQLYNRVTSVISDVKETSKLLESASHIGTNLDNIVRDFFEGKPVAWENYTNRVPITKDNQLNLKQGDQLVDAGGSKFTVNAVNKSKKTVSIKGDKDAVSGDLSIGEYFLVSPMIETKVVFDSFVTQLKDLQQQFDLNREQVLSSGIVLYNDQMGLAGTVDIMTVDDQGIVRIYDMKTMRDNNFTTQATGDSDLSKYDYVYPGDTASKREKHQAQLSLYRMLLANTHGLVAQALEVIPIQVGYNAGDVTTKEAKILPLVSLEPLDFFAGMQINPKVLELAQPAEPEVVEIQSEPLQEPQMEAQPVQPQIEVQDARLEEFTEIFGEQETKDQSVNTLVMDHAQVTEDLAALERGEGVTPMEQVIVDMGGIVTTKESFKEASDAHLMKGMSPAYFKGSETLDQIAKGIAENGSLNLDEAGIREALLQFMLDYPGGIGSVNSTSDRTFHGTMRQRKTQARIQLKDIEARFKKETGISISAYLNMEDSRRKAMMTDQERRLSSQVANVTSLDELAQVEQDAMEAFSTGDLEATGGVSSIEISTMIEEKEKELAPVADDRVTPQDQMILNDNYAAPSTAEDLGKAYEEAKTLTVEQMVQRMKEQKDC